MDGQDKKCGDREFVIPVPLHPDGTVGLVSHNPDHSLTVDLARPLEEGTDMRGKTVLQLVKNEDGPGYRKEYLHDGRAGKPAMVNGPEFRSGWEAVFGKKKTGAPN